MAKKAKNLKDQNTTSRPWGTLATLAISALIVCFVSWYGALYYGKQMAQFYVKNEARNWSDLALDNLNAQERSFKNSKLSRGDQYIIKDFYNGTNMYRVLFLNESGSIFWSSRPNEKGPYDNWEFFKGKLMQGQQATRFQTVHDEKIVGLTLKAHSVLVKSYAIKEHNEHTIVEIARPVYVDDKFAGAIIMFKDITSVIVWMEKQSQLIAAFLGGIIILIFAIIAAMMWKYSITRNRQNQQLQKAKNQSDEAGQEAREMATQLQEMNSDIAVLNADLNANMKELHHTQNEVIRKGKMAQLGQLTATVAHDIRNPLGSIRTSTYLLRRKFSGDNPKMDKPLSRIEKGVARCDGIITELLDFARTKDLDLKSRDLDEWLLNIVQETAEQLPQSVSFECNLGLANKEINFDGDSLARAIINFVTNASEAMVGKGNDLPTTPTKNPLIAITTQLSERGVEISVTDNGPGITPENLEKIRDPLFTTKSFGVGLGLPSVEKIFEKHQGGMEIESSQGNGATFTGWFPLDLSAQDAEKKVA